MLTDDLVTIGVVGKAHGLKGEFRCIPETDFPERFLDTEKVYLHNGQAPVLKRVESARAHGGRILLKLEGIDSPTDAKQWLHYQVAVPEDELVELEEGEFYHFELEGADVEDENGQRIGVLQEVLENPAHEIYVVKTAQGDLLIPAVPEYILEISDERIRVKVPVHDDAD